MENCFVETYNSTRAEKSPAAKPSFVGSFARSLARSLARSRSFPPAYRLERFALDDAIARYQIFERQPRAAAANGIGNERASGTLRFVHSVNKTPKENGMQSTRACVLANRILSIYPSLASRARARANSDRSCVAPGMHPAGNVIISPRPRERSSLERSLPALNALPLPSTPETTTFGSAINSRARSDPQLQMHAQTCEAPWRTCSPYISRAGACEEIRPCWNNEVPTVPLRKDRQRQRRRFHYRYGEMRLTSHNGNNTPMRYKQRPNVHTRLLRLNAIPAAERETLRTMHRDNAALSLPVKHAMRERERERERLCVCVCVCVLKKKITLCNL